MLAVHVCYIDHELIHWNTYEYIVEATLVYFEKRTAQSIYKMLSSKHVITTKTIVTQDKN